MPKQYKFLFLPSLLILFLVGCNTHRAPRYKDGYIYRNIYFGRNLSPAFKQGVRDGCETARGIYSKAHTLFNHDNDYYNGWFLGRKKCRHLLKIDEYGDLVL